MMALNLLHGVCVYLTATYMLSIPQGVSFDTAIDAMGYTLRQILGPILAILFLSFQVKAISRLWVDDRFKTTKHTESAHWSKVLDRCQHQTFEQTVTTVFTSMLIAMVVSDFPESEGGDIRLPIAWGLVFAAMRPLFTIGYVLDPKGAGRAFGLFIGGFWANFPAAVYCSLHTLFDIKSFRLALRLYIGFAVLMSVVMGVANVALDKNERSDDIRAGRQEGADYQSIDAK
eukprot:CAMPEP_0167780060 /NCGR_PEP_ID=MMETSP0111_2-20121227/5146_1 /TAXON_ID=91324 /ORGANISM="Lotharella globosa, Strain CCCM811" /LENGTH=229 /DNA_ID=CAMNT_0007670527 /DNA_START=1 /DNA_END=690 /DNA_ORIENTATION=-